MVTEEGVYLGQPPLISAVNTVGCGDFMTAALAVGLYRDYGIQEILRYGVAVSAANAMSLQTRHFRQEDLNYICALIVCCFL
ncbi:MAG: PfkB family carbohydrate kinase [Lachnospiraceae bacterium]|jgi:tagatose 6-phosphate kinase|nr:PfkB family carbohydrate kinase [Lachnospiraceae bacterium]